MASFASVRLWSRLRSVDKFANLLISLNLQSKRKISYKLITNAEYKYSWCNRCVHWDTIRDYFAFVAERRAEQDLEISRASSRVSNDDLHSDWTSGDIVRENSIKK